MFLKTVTASILFLLLAACSSGKLSPRPASIEGAEVVNPWGQVTTPSSGHEGPIGSYSAGCLDGASALPLQGPGYEVMRLSRHRYFGDPLLIDFIESLGEAAVQQKLGVLLIGDMSQPRGGPMPTGHLSHQIGLDVDIWYWLDSAAQERLLTPEERENLSAPAMVDLKSDQLNRKLWQPEDVKILKFAAEMPDVERIFVNPVIKRELCQTVGSDRAWLHKIRPWWEHQDHFHVRLRCPGDDPVCHHQSPIPPGDGCDAQLDWWFTPEGRQEPVSKGPRVIPKLPDACSGVLKS